MLLDGKLANLLPADVDTVYKMANSAKEGTPKTEEVRLASGLKSGDEGARWFRISARKEIGS